MNQSSVAGTKRKPSILSLRPPKLRSPQQMHKHREADLPRTPYPVPSKGWKRSVSFSEEEDSPQEGEAKKRKTAGYKALLSTPSHLASFPSLDSGYPPASQRHGIPSVELMKAWESILDQVDWSEVMQDAGGRGKPNIYRDVFQTIVQSHVEEQLEQEECREDEHSKRDEKDSDTESRNDSNEDSARNGFHHFEDNIFVESDKSGFGSEDYADEENDDEEDSDDENQDGDDYEVVDDGDSI